MTTAPKCQRCESKEPAKQYDPRSAGHPDKRVNLCDKCADADPKAVLNPPIDVPAIEPSVPEAENTVETIKFTPESGGPSITTPKNAPPPDPAPEPINTEGTIPRSEIVGELQRREADIVKLAESHQTLLAQQRTITAKISDTLKTVAIQQGAAAQLRKTLGITKE